MLLNYLLGIINLHPSLLPKYRGPSPIETAILSGDNYTGVSIMLLDKVWIRGPFLPLVHVEDFEDAKDLYDKLGKIGAKLMSNVLPKIISGELQATPPIFSRCELPKNAQRGWLIRSYGFFR